MKRNMTVLLSAGLLTLLSGCSVSLHFGGEESESDTAESGNLP